MDARPGTEWFKEEIRAELEPILEAIVKNQIDHMETITELSAANMERIVRVAHTKRGYELKGRDEVRLLARTAGYVVQRRSHV